MVLSEEDIAKFQALYLREFGEEITKEAAYEQGIKLLNLVSSVYKSMTQDEHDLIQSRRKESLPALIKTLLNNEHKGNYHEEVS